MDSAGDAGAIAGQMPAALGGSEAETTSASATPPWTALGILSAATLLTMSLWFSASAVVPTLLRVWHISGATANWLTAAVQIGFVSGALVSATLGLPDLVNARKLL